MADILSNKGQIHLKLTLTAIIIPVNYNCVITNYFIFFSKLFYIRCPTYYPYVIRIPSIPFKAK